MSEPNQYQLIEQTIFDLAPAFERVAVDNTINFAREAEFAIQVVCGSDYMREIACKNPQSLRDAVTNISAIGISLNPAKKQAYLVPRKGGITLMISYMGLLDLAIQTGSILWGQAEIVYASDTFELNGYDKAPTHKRQPFAKDRGEILGAYVVAKTIDGDYLTTTMTIAEIFEIRDRSDAWKQFLAKKTKCPWVTDETEMLKKTVIKRASKTWPRSERLDKAVHHLNTDGGEGITFAEEVPTDETPIEAVQPPQRKSQPKPDSTPDVEDAREVVQPEPEPEGCINAGQVKYLLQKFKALDLSDTAFDELLTKHDIKHVDTTITLVQFDALKKDLLAL